MNQLQRHLFNKPRRKSVCQDAAKVIQPKLDNTQYGFRSGCSTTEQISTLQQIFEKCWEHAKDLYRYFVELGKVCDLCGRVLREKLKSLYSCSDDCDRVWRVKPRPFNVGVRLKQWCVLSS